MLDQGFGWVAAGDARVLVLGSMPGRASLAAGRYYAHPRNAFWPLMGELFGAGPELDYVERLDRLTAQGVALWDVVHRCRRPGSLDAAIVRETVEANDFNALFAHCPDIHSVFFNGTAAYDLYRRHVLPVRPAGERRLVRLPSTSPANAALSYEQKRQAWQTLRDALDGVGERAAAGE